MQNALMKSAAALVMLTGCTTMAPVTETEAALCEAWRGSLPSRSRMDTEQTQTEIGRAYAVQKAVCR